MYDGHNLGLKRKRNKALNILTKKDLCNVILIVTRYFGGTLLGTGGLIRAYSEATLLALDNAGIVTQEPGEEMEVIIKYSEWKKNNKRERRGVRRWWDGSENRRKK